MMVNEHRHAYMLNEKIGWSGSRRRQSGERSREWEFERRSDSEPSIILAKFYVEGERLSLISD